MKRTMMNRLISGMIGLAIAVTPLHSFAGGGGSIAGATEPTQIANNVELVMQYAKQIEQYALQLKQWKDQVQNTLNIPNQIWSAIESDLIGVMQVVQRGQALAFSMANIGEQFQIRFPGFKPTRDFIADYRVWSQTMRDTISGTLEAANLQSQQFATEEQVLEKLRSMSQTNEGRLQALQTGNQIAVEVAAQIQKLRALTMAQIQAQTVYMGKQEQEQDTMKATIHELLERDDIRKGKKYRSH